MLKTVNRKPIFRPKDSDPVTFRFLQTKTGFITYFIIKRPARDACLCMGELQAPPAPHFVFLITL